MNTIRNNGSLFELRRKMKKGDVTKIADRTGFSPSYVSNVLNGRRNNTEIVSTAKAITRKRK